MSGPEEEGVLMSSSYNADLVILSVVVACIASYAALDLAAHLARRGASKRWLLGAATAMGIGIWSMHFIGMLAYRLPVAVAYEPTTVVLSLLIAVLGSGIGLRVAGQAAPRRRSLALTGPAMGLAIAGMHYTGMAAMRLPGTQHYAAGPVLLSILVAIVASYAAIALFLRFRHDRTRRGFWLKVVSAVVMGHAVAGMHYTAMWAVHFNHGPAVDTGVVLPPRQIAVAIALVTVVLLALVVVAAMMDRWMQTQVDIRRNDERFQAMVEALHDHAVYTVDAEGRIDSWNRGAERLFGRSQDEILGQPLGILYPAGSEEAADQELARALEAGTHETESQRLRGSGDVRLVNSITTPMRGSDGQLLGFARIVRDITEKSRAEADLRRSEELLRQAQKMEAVGQLAGGVAHDFNNMLTAIRGYAELLRRDATPGTESDDALGEITSAADRAAELTRQLLAFSRKQVLQPAAVNPNAIVVDMERMLRRLLVGNVQLVTDLRPEVGNITVDPAQLQQVLMNLALNARDALPRGGTVRFTTSNVDLTEEFARQHPGAHAGPHVMLSVADDGVGIPAAIRDHVFEPFFTTKELGSGTGLGLATVYGIVKQSDGYIWFESEEGRGTTFHVCFPRRAGPDTAPSQCPEASAPPAGGATVLLVDDEPGVRRLLERVLGKQGYHVLGADSASKAVDVAEAHRGPIELLITDIMMPGMNGAELADRLRGVRPDTKVLYVSGYASDEVIERGLLDPSKAFIQKPFSASELLEKVHQVLAQRQASPRRGQPPAQ